MKNLAIGQSHGVWLKLIGISWEIAQLVKWMEISSFFLSVIWNKNFVEEIECHILAAYLSDCDVLSGRFIHDSERLLPLGQEWAKGYGSIFRTIKLFLLVMNAVTNFLVDDQRLGIYFTCAQVTQSGYNNDDLLRSFESMQIDQCFQVY